MISGTHGHDECLERANLTQGIDRFQANARMLVDDRFGEHVDCTRNLVKPVRNHASAGGPCLVTAGRADTPQQARIGRHQTSA